MNRKFLLILIPNIYYIGENIIYLIKNYIEKQKNENSTFFLILFSVKDIIFNEDHSDLINLFNKFSISYEKIGNHESIEFIIKNFIHSFFNLYFDLKSFK